MPQPFRGDERARFGAEAILERPHLAAHIGAIATLWTYVEESWGTILAQVLNADARVGVEMYLSLTGATSQNAILNTAIKYAATDEATAKEFGELLKAAKGPAKERNRVVHGRWGILPSREDVLILGERDWTPRAVAEIHHFYSRANRNALLPNPKSKADVPEFSRQIYTEVDFKNIEARIKSLANRQSEFAEKLWKQLFHATSLPSIQSSPGNVLGS